MHGSYAANIAMTDADFMLAIGCRFDDRLTGNPKTLLKMPRLFILMYPAEIGKIIAVDLPVVGDAKQALKCFAEPVVQNITENGLKKSQRQGRVRSYDKKERMVQPQAVIEPHGELTKGDAADVVTDVGQHQMWTAPVLSIPNERQLRPLGGLGTMGIRCPKALVPKLLILIKKLSFVGDGGFK